MAHKKYDITLKDIIGQYADGWAGLAGVQSPRSVEVFNADISTLAAEADHVMLIQEEFGDAWLLYLELQAGHQLGWPDMMHYKSTALRKRHGLLVRSLILLLRREAKTSDLSGELKLQIESDPVPYLEFRYQVLNLWEQSSSALLSGNLGLVPLATLTDDAAMRLPEVISKIDERIRQEVSWEEAEKLRTATIHLMGLRYKTEIVAQLIEGVMHMTLESSSVYQSALSKGRIEGKLEGKSEGKLEGKLEGIVEGIEAGRLQEVKTILLRLGTAKLGAPDSHSLARIDSITAVEPLEAFTDRLLLVTSWKSLLE